MPMPQLVYQGHPDSKEDYIPSAEVLLELPDEHQNIPEDLRLETPGPVLRAAKIPDIRILRGLLRSGGFWATSLIVGPLYGPWENALNASILTGLPSHTRLLVDHGANINGFPDWCFEAASSRFIRGRSPSLTLSEGAFLPDRKSVLKDVDSSLRGNQTQPLLEQEIVQRRQARSRFWAESDFPRTDFPTDNPRSSVSAYAQLGDQEGIMFLRDHGADETAWISPYGSLLNNTTPSYLAVDTPLHIAVVNEDEEMIRFLLNSRHRPDIFPLALVTRCMNAVMTTITKKDPWLRGFEIIAPQSNLSLSTPMFACNILHFAVATLNLDLIKHVLAAMSDGIKEINKNIRTALGHTLLHIASLPLDDTIVNLHSVPIYTSIHDFRTLDTAWVPLQLRSEPMPISSGPVPRGGARGTFTFRGQTMHRGRGLRGGGYAGRGGYSRDQPRFTTTSVTERRNLRNILLFLLKHISDVRCMFAEQDAHGNTILHYLACFRGIDENFVEEIRVLADRAMNLETDTGSELDVGNDKGNLSQGSSTAKGNAAENWDVWENVGEKIRNVWGFSAADLYRSNLLARQHEGKEYMPFWRG